MPYPSIGGFQIAKSLTVNTTAITTPAWFIGDFRQLSISASTQSNNAINVQTSNADGFSEAIPENSWANVLAISVNSVFNLTTGARWSRTSSPASSNATLIFAGHT